MDICSIENCPYPARTRELCSRHYRRQLHSERGECKVEGCITKWHSSGLCVKHYTRLRSWGTTDDPPMPPLKGNCSINGCDSAIKARNLCEMHLQRWYRFGTTELVQKNRFKKRTCRFCKEKLPSEKFILQRASVCIDCLPLYRAECKAKRLIRTPEIRALEAELYEKQQGCCAMCGTHEKDSPKGKLHLDHQASPFMIRGLLCGKCNPAIGLLNHDPELLARGSKYLRFYLLASAAGQPTGP